MKLPKEAKSKCGRRLFCGSGKELRAKELSHPVTVTGASTEVNFGLVYSVRMRHKKIERLRRSRVVGAGLSMMAKNDNVAHG